jgi:hypothetical protein
MAGAWQQKPVTFLKLMLKRLETEACHFAVHLPGRRLTSSKRPVTMFGAAADMGEVLEIIPRISPGPEWRNGGPIIS